MSAQVSKSPPSSLSFSTPCSRRLVEGWDVALDPKAAAAVLSETLGPAIAHGDTPPPPELVLATHELGMCLWRLWRFGDAGAEVDTPVADSPPTSSPTERLRSRALSLLLKAAHAGYAPAQAAAGQALLAQQEAGRGADSSQAAEGVRLLRAAADAADPDALCALGAALEEGVGVPAADAPEAAALYAQAHELGSVEAARRLASCRARGVGVPTDLVGAVTLYRIAAEGGDVDAQYEHAVRMLAAVADAAPGHLSQAVDWLKKAAAQGHAVASLRLSECLRNGTGGTAPDPEGAALALIAAAKAGLADAQNDYGMALLRGTGGVAKDPARALLWFENAKAQGHRGAAFNALRCRFAGGRGTAEGGAEPDVGGAAGFADDVSALQVAAEGGSTQAQYALAAAFRRGTAGSPGGGVDLEQVNEARVNLSNAHSYAASFPPVRRRRACGLSVRLSAVTTAPHLSSHK